MGQGAHGACWRRHGSALTIPARGGVVLPWCCAEGKAGGMQARGKVKRYPRTCSSFTANMKSLLKAMVISTGSFGSRAQEINVVSVWDPLCLLSEAN